MFMPLFEPYPFVFISKQTNERNKTRTLKNMAVALISSKPAPPTHSILSFPSFLADGIKLQLFH